MSNVLASVDKRTNLVGENRLELLVFLLSSRQKFAINVFKVQEVLKLQSLVSVPHSHYCICGVTTIRNRTIPIIDLSLAVGMQSIAPTVGATIIVTEYNRTVQAFLVRGVERIVNMNWEEIEAPPVSAGRQHYLTAITRIEKDIVEVIDVEKVLSEITPLEISVSGDLVDADLVASVAGRFILVVDDSPVAISQVKGTIESMGIDVVTARNGSQALNLLKSWAISEPEKLAQLLLIVTDAEMPEMDGYRLTSEIRADPLLTSIYVVMHTSLSGSFNESMVKKVGCDDFLSKFKTDELVEVVTRGMRKILQ